MRKLTDTETEKARQYFDVDKCEGCRYVARIAGQLRCGMVYQNCLVTVPVCLERNK